MGNILEVLDDLRLVSLADIRNDVADLLVRLQILPEDVDPVLRDHPVDRGQDPGLVGMNVNESMSPAQIRKLHLRNVHTREGVARIDEVDERAGYVIRDVRLSFLGASPDVRGQNDVGKSLEPRTKSGMRCDRLLGKDTEANSVLRESGQKSNLIIPLLSC